MKKSKALLREEAERGMTYEEFSEDVLRRRQLCEGSVIRRHGLLKRSEQLHHRLGRGQGGALMDEANVLPVCAACHRYLTDHPAEARALGISKGRWKT